jgi:hypothetical protein
MCGEIGRVIGNLFICNSLAYGIIFAAEIKIGISHVAPKPSPLPLSRWERKRSGEN